MNQSNSIEDYIKQFPEKTQDALHHVYTTIKQTLPHAEETISYGLPTFKIKGKNIVHFGGFNHHIGFYPTPYGINQFRQELSLYKGAKGSVQFPLDKPMPLDLIKRITQYRLQMAEEEGKKKR